MRISWPKSKGEQLDLLATLPASRSQAAPPTQPAGSTAGRPLLVATSALVDDPGNPRRDQPADELAELADDIRQHGILQPIVVNPIDSAGHYRIHFGARRWRAAQMAGLDQVPIILRDAPCDPYAQVAENQKRHGLTPLDLARFIRTRIDAGESNSEVARRLGMNLTSVAHHLALLELPPALDEALTSGRCTSPRTLHELGKLHDQDPEQVQRLLAGGAEISRAKVAALRARQPTAPASSRPEASQARRIAQALKACDRLERALQGLDLSDDIVASVADLVALRARIDSLACRWLKGSDRQTPSKSGA